MAITAITVASGAYSISSQRKQAKAQKRAAAEQRKSIRAQQASQNYQAARQRRQQAAQARMLRAQQVAGGFSSGIGTGSSAVQGAVGSIGSTFGGNIGASNIAQGLANQASIFNQNAAGFTSQANQYAMNSQLGSSIFGWAAPQANFSNLNPFGTRSTPAPVVDRTGV